MSRHLDLGCGLNPRNPYNRDDLYGVDIVCPKNDISKFKSANLFTEEIPFDSSFFDSVSAYDFIEHIPRVIVTSKLSKVRFSFVELMYEIWRVLKPGGVFFASTPFFPNSEVFVDPTHVNYITENTHNYFCGDPPLAEIYGFQGKFRKIKVCKWKPREEYAFEQKSLSQKFKILRDLIKRRRTHIAWELVAIKEF